MHASIVCNLSTVCLPLGHGFQEKAESTRGSEREREREREEVRTEIKELAEQRGKKQRLTL